MFLNEPGPGTSLARAFQDLCPAVLAKIRGAAARACSEEGWITNSNGPLSTLEGGVEALHLRVVEHWTYQVGGGLVDLLHYDTDSIVTLVTMLSDSGDFEGGVFSTNECDGTSLGQPMEKGGCLCLLSHKYHNVTPVAAGTRRVMVTEF